MAPNATYGYLPALPAPTPPPLPRYSVLVRRRRGRQGGHRTTGRPGWAPVPALPPALARRYGAAGRYNRAATYLGALARALALAALLGRWVRVVPYQCPQCGCAGCA